MTGRFSTAVTLLHERNVTRGLGMIASLGLGGALVYTLQTCNSGRPPEELYSTDNRSTADGLQGLP